MTQIFSLAPPALAFTGFACRDARAKTRVRENVILADFQKLSDLALFVTLQNNQYVYTETTLK